MELPKILVSFSILFLIISCTKSDRIGPGKDIDSTSPYNIQKSENSIDNSQERTYSLPYKSYPDFNLPIISGLLKKFEISKNDISQIAIPDSVKKEKVLFKNLVSKPDVKKINGKRYILVTSKQVVKIHKEPLSSSQVRAYSFLGDIFLYEGEQQLPADPEKLPEEELQKLKERYEPEWERFLIEYRENSGVLLGGYYNKWIKVLNNEYSGWIFGANIYIASYKEVILLRELYKRGSVFSSFQDYFINIDYGSTLDSYGVSLEPYAFNNFPDYKESISNSIKKSLIKNYIAIQKISPDNYTLSIKKPDDMFSLYLDSAYSQLNPLFITTDFVIHTLNIIFSKAILEAEEQYLFPFLERISRYYFNRLLQYRGVISDRRLLKSIDYLLSCFGMGLYLMGYLTISDRAVLPDYIMDSFMKEAAYIQEGKGKNISPLKGVIENYTFYKHERKHFIDEENKKYFNTLLWYLSLKFNLSNIEDSRAAFLLTFIIGENKEALSDYTFFSKAFSYLLGFYNPVTLVDCLDILKEEDEVSYIEDLEANQVINKYSEKVIKQLIKKHPASNEDTTEENKGNKYIFFLGELEHTIIDIFSLLICKETGDGSKIKVKDMLTDFYLEYNNSVSNSKTNSKYQSEYNCSTTYPDTYLSLLRNTLAFPGDKVLPWFNNKEYIKKRYITFLSSFVEQNYNVILETGQRDFFYDNTIGNYSIYDIRRDPLPKPRGYIEPAFEFFNKLLRFYNKLTDIPAGQLLFSTNMGESLTLFFSEIDWMLYMVNRELSFKPIDSYDYDHIFEIPEIFTHLCFPENFAIQDYQNSIEAGINRIARIKKIYTSTTDEEDYYFGTGIPQRLYIAISDPDGGRRVCVGYINSLYELKSSEDNKQLIENWKKMVHEKNKRNPDFLKKYEPEWLQIK